MKNFSSNPDTTEKVIQFADTQVLSVVDRKKSLIWKIKEILQKDRRICRDEHINNKDKQNRINFFSRINFDFGSKNYYKKEALTTKKFLIF